MKRIIFIVSFLAFLVWGTVRVTNDILFNRGSEGHLKRAADANTIELAKQEVEVAVKYLEDNNMTSGYTSIVYTTPDEDIGFWYKNLKSSLEELKKVSPEATQLEKSNLLIKLRETILDEGQNVSVTVPFGISVFPNNGFWAFVGCLSVILLLGSSILLMGDWL